MKKTISFFAAVFFISLFTQAQGLRFGVDPGIALSRGKYTPFSGERRIYAGFDGGAFVEIGATRFKLQGEVNYTMVGVELNNGTTEYTIKHSYVTVPVMLKYKLAKVSFLTGPQIDFLLSAKTDTSGAGSLDVKDQFKSTSFDWVFGTEIKITKSVFLGIRYVVGLTNVSERLNFEMKNRYVSFRIGYALGK